MGNFELNGKVYRTEGFNDKVCLIDELGKRYLTFKFNDKTYLTDEDGYLADMKDWNKDLAEHLAKEENVGLTDAHWGIINFLREYYEEKESAPAVFVLIKVVGEKFGLEKKESSKYLYSLYPQGPAKQACKIAGLPKPTGCV